MVVFGLYSLIGSLVNGVVGPQTVDIDITLLVLDKVEVIPQKVIIEDRILLMRSLQFPLVQLAVFPEGEEAQVIRVPADLADLARVRPQRQLREEVSSVDRVKGDGLWFRDGQVLASVGVGQRDHPTLTKVAVGLETVEQDVYHAHLVLKGHRYMETAWVEGHGLYLLIELVGKLQSLLLIVPDLDSFVFGGGNDQLLHEADTQPGYLIGMEVLDERPEPEVILIRHLFILVDLDHHKTPISKSRDQVVFILLNEAVDTHMLQRLIVDSAVRPDIGVLGLLGVVLVEDELADIA